MANHEDPSYSETGFLCHHAEKQALSEQREVPDDHHSSRGINTKVYSLELTWELSPAKTKNTPILIQNRGSLSSSGEGGIRRNRFREQPSQLEIDVSGFLDPF